MTRKSPTLTLLVAAALATIALPAAAGSWPNLPAKKAPARTVTAPAPAAVAAPDGFVLGAEEGGYSLQQYSYFRQEEDSVTGPKRPIVAAAGVTAVVANDPFEAVGGDTGWQLKQHKYVFAAGRLAHSEECDHAIRTATAPTPAEIERARNASPGA